MNFSFRRQAETWYKYKGRKFIRTKDYPFVLGCTFFCCRKRNNKQTTRVLPKDTLCGGADMRRRRPPRPQKNMTIIAQKLRRTPPDRTRVAPPSKATKSIRSQLHFRPSAGAPGCCARVRTSVQTVLGLEEGGVGASPTDKQAQINI